jgi:hypothetical protein
VVEAQAALVSAEEATQEMAEAMGEMDVLEVVILPLVVEALEDILVLVVMVEVVAVVVMVLEAAVVVAHETAMVQVAVA